MHRLLYDEQFPQAADKLGKKLGAKVGKGEVPVTRLDEPHVGEGDFPYEIRRPDGTVWNSTRTREAAEAEAADHPGFTIHTDEELLKERTKGEPVHTLDITPELRKAATEQGFPLFQKGAEGEPQGRVTFVDNKRIVELFKSANASTAIHELGHVWFEELVADAGRADAPQALKDDLATVLKWLGVDRPEDIGTPHHEHFARGFEQYLREGKAPSSTLAAVFEKFKAWLTAIYRSLTELGTPISDEMRGVFDRMLATDEQIAAARHPAAVLADLPPRVREDALRATVADLAAGNVARTGEMLNEAAKDDPRIAESVNGEASGTRAAKQFGAFAPPVRTGVAHMDRTRPGRGSISIGISRNLSRSTTRGMLARRARAADSKPRKGLPTSCMTTALPRATRPHVPILVMKATPARSRAAPRPSTSPMREYSVRLIAQSGAL
jgi:hypothetical protein